MPPARFLPVLINEDITELTESLSVFGSGADISAKDAAGKKPAINNAEAHNVFFIMFSFRPDFFSED